MAFIVEDGSVVAGANSYSTTLSADNYWVDRGIPAEWAAAIDTDKQAALIRGTQYVDGVFRTRWKGFRVKPLQSLGWPRMGVYEGSIMDSNYYISSDTVPVKLRNAVAELAWRHLKGAVLIPDRDEAPLKSSSTTVGPIVTAKQFAGADSAWPRYRIVDSLIGYLLQDTFVTLERS